MAWRPIQTNTAGLLSLLGIKNVGKNPDALLEVVQPTSEMGAWWLRGASFPFYQEKVLAANDEAVDFITAANNEWVHFHYGFGFMFAPSPGTDNAINLLILKATGVTQLIWATKLQYIDTASGGSPSATATLPDHGIWIPPGFTLRLNCYGTIGDTAGLAGLVTRVQV